MTQRESAGALFLKETSETFRSQKHLAERAISQVKDEHLHVPLDENTNAIAVIMKHIAGNLLSRWTEFLTTDGEKPWRERDGEFVDDFTSREETVDFWEQGWTRLFETLSELTETDLATTITIRGEPHTVLRATQRAIGHIGFHVGQIVLLARHLAKDDWTTLSIPRGSGESDECDHRVRKGMHP